jgi:hypothetical protein
MIARFYKYVPMRRHCSSVHSNNSFTHIIAPYERNVNERKNAA